MPYALKPPTGQAVSAALKRAGFNRSVILTGTGRLHFDGRPVRGSERRSEGYEVKSRDGQIQVQHRYGPGGPVNERVIRHRAVMTQRYADALVIAGFRVRLDHGSVKLAVLGRLR